MGEPRQLALFAADPPPPEPTPARPQEPAYLLPRPGGAAPYRVAASTILGAVDTEQRGRSLVTVSIGHKGRSLVLVDLPAASIMALIARSPAGHDE